MTRFIIRSTQQDAEPDSSPASASRVARVHVLVGARSSVSYLIRRAVNNVFPFIWNRSTLSSLLLRRQRQAGAVYAASREAASSKQSDATLLCQHFTTHLRRKAVMGEMCIPEQAHGWISSKHTILYADKDTFTNCDDASITNEKSNG